eukprot:11967131-Prorocentrum_lima.AAC.1
MLPGSRIDVTNRVANGCVYLLPRETCRTQFRSPGVDLLDVTPDLANDVVHNLSRHLGCQVRLSD